MTDMMPPLLIRAGDASGGGREEVQTLRAPKSDTTGIL
jgi:hypothetical protein